jgi:heptosyltransferase-2
LAPQLTVTDEEVQLTAEKFGLADLIGGGFLLLGLNPGAEHNPAKRWPADRFIEAAALVQRHVKCRWLVFGNRAEAALSEKIAADIAYEAERPPTSGRLPPDRAAVNLAGRTSLRELMALLRLCRVLLTNATGPMHVAAALGTPVVATFGSTVPEIAGPGLSGDPRHRLLKANAPCSPCFLRECPIDLRCLTDISVEQAAQAMMELLNR